MKFNMRLMVWALGSLPFYVFAGTVEGAIATSLDNQHRDGSGDTTRPAEIVDHDPLAEHRPMNLTVEDETDDVLAGSTVLMLLDTRSAESLLASPQPSSSSGAQFPSAASTDGQISQAPANEPTPDTPDIDSTGTATPEPLSGSGSADSPTIEGNDSVTSESSETVEPDSATVGDDADADPAPSDDDAIADPAATDETHDNTETRDSADEQLNDEQSDSDDDQLDEELAAWQQLLIEGDRFFLQGDYVAAEQRYQEAKDPDDEDADPVERPEAYTDPALLPPAGQVYWREYQAGLETGLDTRIMVPLKLLSEQYPEFIPGQIDYALLLTDSDDEEAKQRAAEQLEQGTALFPNNAELARARVDFLAQDEQWLQAAIAARQFTILNPEASETPEFEADAEQYQRRFRSRLRGRITRNAIGNALTGAVGVAVTGNPFGAFSALETTILMLRGESAVGRSIANRAAEELDLIEDDAVVAYVDEIGQSLASLAGRDEFEYEFYVVAEPELNAFALPGGKIFVNAGAILKAQTEAEFAGLLAHELAHAVLSHGFQLATRGNLTANIFQFIPFGGLATNLAVLRYSRGMERQADALGTQLLANSDYAADGLHRLMITLNEESDRRSRLDWLSTHPDTPERIRNIDRLIDNNGYNRYSFEGIERHLEIQARVEQLLREADKLNENDGEFVIEDNTNRDEVDGDEPNQDELNPDGSVSPSDEMPQGQPQEQDELSQDGVTDDVAPPDSQGSNPSDDAETSNPEPES